MSKHPDSGTKTNPTLEQHLQVAINHVFQQSKINPKQIDKAFVSNFQAERFCNQGHLGVILPLVCPEISGKPIIRVEASGTSGGAALICCVETIQAGCNFTLATGVEIETNVPGKKVWNICHWPPIFKNKDTWNLPYFHIFLQKEQRYIKKHLMLRVEISLMLLPKHMEKPIEVTLP